MRYKIELRYFYGWDDACWTDETDEAIEPTRFRTVAEAKVALDEFFADVRAALIVGDMDSEIDRHDYRIVEAND